ncbi:MAG TPA: polyprenyl synthetase family protein, partial [Nannocystis exedens]|nr:polyprenyl synthetase family protein [Nannocystis exedens]
MSEAVFELIPYLEKRRVQVDTALREVLPAADADDPGKLKDAMRYGVLLGGKRMRPMVTIAACEALGGASTDALPPACAVEMIHAYSLVHDDLPAMDNDLERRGVPT